MSKQFLICAFEFIGKKVPLKIWIVFILFAFNWFHIPESHLELWFVTSVLLCYFTFLLPLFHLFQMKESYFETKALNGKASFNLAIDFNHIIKLRSFLSLCFLNDLKIQSLRNFQFPKAWLNSGTLFISLYFYWHPGQFFQELTFLYSYLIKFRDQHTQMSSFPLPSLRTASSGGT